jgi:hypothetical protein
MFENLSDDLHWLEAKDARIGVIGCQPHFWRAKPVIA